MSQTPHNAHGESFCSEVWITIALENIGSYNLYKIYK